MLVTYSSDNYNVVLVDVAHVVDCLIDVEFVHFALFLHSFVALFFLSNYILVCIHIDWVNL